MTYTQYPYMLNSTTMPKLIIKPDPVSNINRTIVVLTDESSTNGVNNCTWTHGLDSWNGVGTEPVCIQRWDFLIETPEESCSITGEYS